MGWNASCFSLLIDAQVISTSISFFHLSRDLDCLRSQWFALWLKANKISLTRARCWPGAQKVVLFFASERSNKTRKNRLEHFLAVVQSLQGMHLFLVLCNSAVPGHCNKVFPFKGEVFVFCFPFWCYDCYDIQYVCMYVYPKFGPKF